MIRYGGRFLQRRVGGDHLARHQILADAEVFQGTLRLSAPEFIDGNMDFAEAISLLPRVSGCHIHARYPSIPLILEHAVCATGLAGEAIKGELSASEVPWISLGRFSREQLQKGVGCGRR